jgi:VWFA-related protein
MTRRLLSALCLALLGATVLAQQPAQPQPPVTFRVEVNYVEVDAFVTDAQGNPVPGLTADDFEVLEDRKPQTISAFSLVNIPVERAERPLFASAPIEPDVQVNTGGDGRLYMIVLDTLHTQPVNGLKVRAAARRFVERNMGANDVAAVVFTGSQSTDTQDFTGNKRLLLAAIDKFQGLKSPGATLTVTQDVNARISRQPGDPVRDALEFERALNARRSMERIRVLSDFLANVRGRRKAMLLFGEGVEYEFQDILGSTSASGVLETVRDAIGAATRANVAIYAIDPRGLANPDADLIGVPNNVGADDPSLGRLGSRSIADELRTAQNSLRMVSDDTGGFAVLNQNDFTNAFDRIVRENSSYYVLGYYSTNDRRDGRFRTINVRVRRPGLMVRARRGYLAPRGRAPEASPASANTLLATANEALSSPLPVPGIPMQLFAAPYRGEAPNASIAIALEMGTQGFSFDDANGTSNDRVEVTMTAVDVEGKQRATVNHTVSLAIKPETMPRLRERGVRLLSQVDLPPGRYQLRAAAAEAGGQKTGSVIADVEIPDFSKGPVTMSGLSLTSSSASDAPTVKARDPLSQFLPGPPTTVREFTAGEELGLFAEFYENLRNAPPHKFDITTTIRTDDGRVVSMNTEERDSRELQGSVGGFGYMGVVSLKDLSPGLYVIHVEGRSRATGVEAGVGRDIQIRVK